MDVLGKLELVRELSREVTAKARFRGVLGQVSLRNKSKEANMAASEETCKSQSKSNKEERGQTLQIIEDI